MKILDCKNTNVSQVVDDGLLMVGLHGFTLEDLAILYPGLGIALHVLDGDKWVPITIDEINKEVKHGANNNSDNRSSSDTSNSTEKR